MAALYPTAYPPQTIEDQFKFLLLEVQNWSILNGLAVRPSSNFVPKEIDPSGSLAVTAPVTLYPSPFPRSCFVEARVIQKAYNQLYAAIAADERWLSTIVEELVDVDEFIKGLWDIHLAVKKEGYVQDLSLGIFRSDYMVHQDPLKPGTNLDLRQVEFNTIASSFGGLASKVSALHSHLLSLNAYPPIPGLSKDSLPINTSIESIARGLALSHQEYGQPRSQPRLPLCVLFVVQDPESNVFDQLAVSTTLLSRHQVRSFRLPFAEALQHTTIPLKNNLRPLLYTPPQNPMTSFEVTTLYFRAGYSPAEYASAQAWESRLHLERSAAIKCPSILTHLAGSKKIQQILATPSSPYLDRFLGNTEFSTYVARIRGTFALMYPLDRSAAGQLGIKLAGDPATAAKHVLKPQREGGGNNIYGAKIPPFLQSLGNDESKYKSHILMELIEPPTLRNSIFRNGEVRSGQVIGELGIFGVCLWRNQTNEVNAVEMLDNYEGGFLLRTKGRESEEGGVAAGFGSIDSPWLVGID